MMKSPREQLMFYLGQCDEGLESLLIVGMYENGETMVHCTNTTIANACFMVKVAERKVLDGDMPYD